MKMPTVIIIGVIALFCIIQYNTIKSLQKKVDQARSAIDVYLNQRFDLIPNLIECVKGYAKHEKELLAEIVEERRVYDNTKSLEMANRINNHFNSLLALQEAYPDLKASEQFLSLQDSLEKMESQLQAARRLYNGDVTLYNTKITTFPGNIFASLMGAKELELFVIEEYKRENISVKDSL